MRFAESISISENDATVLLQYRVTKTEQGLRLDSSSPLKPAFQDLNLLRFRSRCGTHYVSSIGTGGELIMSFQSSLSEWNSRTDFSLAVRASGGAYTGKLSIDKSREEALSKSNVTIVGRKAGGADNIPYSLDSMREELKTFGRKFSTALTLMLLCSTQRSRLTRTRVLMVQMQLLRRTRLRYSLCIKTNWQRSPRSPRNPICMTLRQVAWTD